MGRKYINHWLLFKPCSDLSKVGLKAKFIMSFQAYVNNIKAKTDKTAEDFKKISLHIRDLF